MILRLEDRLATLEQKFTETMLNGQKNSANLEFMGTVTYEAMEKGQEVNKGESLAPSPAFKGFGFK